MPNKRGIGCGCCFDCNTDDCCDGDVFPDELEVTIPDVFTGGNTGSFSIQYELTVTCDACGSIGGTYVLSHDGNGEYSYTDSAVCVVTNRHKGQALPPTNWDCLYDVSLLITAVFNCNTGTGDCQLTVGVEIGVVPGGTPQGGGPLCQSLSVAFNSSNPFEKTTWQLAQGQSFGDCTARSWTVPWIGFQDAFGGDSDTTPSLCTSAGSGSDVTVDQV